MYVIATIEFTCVIKIQKYVHLCTVKKTQEEKKIIQFCGNTLNI